MIETVARPTFAVRLRPVLGAAAAFGGIIALSMALFWAPPDAVQGEVQRILYVHVPAAWLAYLAFVVVFLASVGWLWSKKPIFDAVAVASAEIGVLFTFLTLVLGAIYAEPTWGTWWTPDPRVLTTTAMFVMYVGYLLVRSLATDLERRATLAAALGIIFVVDIPIVHLSVLWWNSTHQLPTVLRAGGNPSMEEHMLVTLMVCTFVGTLLYAYLMVERVAIERSRQHRTLEARR